MGDAKFKKNRLTNEAIVLAASRGSAMSTLTISKPKAMVKVKDKSILEHISNAYEEHGINKITVVRGYKKEAVNLPNLKYIDNEDFSNTSELVSFKQALESRKEDFFISFGDVLFKPNVLKIMDEINDDMVIAVDSEWQNSVNKARAADYVECSEPFSRDSYKNLVTLKNCSEDLHEENIHGEWMGVAKFSKKSIPILKEAIKFLESKPDFHKAKFHHLFQFLAETENKIRVAYTNGNWLDIDTFDEVIEASNFLVLLNPGPVNLSKSVRHALTTGDVCHRETEFGDLVKRINKRLVEVYPSIENYESVVLSSSGTGAVEAMLTSFIQESEETLVVNNGVYGERMKKILEAQGKPVHSIEFDIRETINLNLLEDAIKKNKKITNLLMVHHETTTGRLNSINEVGLLCKQYNLRLYLDAVSSFGAEEIKADEINLFALAASANKCLHGAPGASFVVANQEMWSNKPKKVSSVYLDLYNYHKLQHTDGFSPFTQATHVLFAFDKALDEFFLHGGWDKRNEVYRERANLILETLLRLGIETFIPKEDFSSVLHSYVLPKGSTYRNFHTYMKEHGFIVYQGQGELSKSIFRISTMGEISFRDISHLCDLLKKYFDK